MNDAVLLICMSAPACVLVHQSRQEGGHARPPAAPPLASMILTRVRRNSMYFSPNSSAAFGSNPAAAASFASLPDSR
jgi:hypothetical protein